jgi:hypothetical protein
MNVEGNLILGVSPFSKKYSTEEIKQMVPGIKGEIYI